MGHLVLPEKRDEGRREGELKRERKRGKAKITNRTRTNRGNGETSGLSWGLGSNCIVYINIFVR